MKKVLIISYAFPPMNVAGSFRPLRFVKYLSLFGWTASVLTVRGREDILQDWTLLKEVPANVAVHKAGEIDPFTIIMPRQPNETNYRGFIAEKRRRISIRAGSVLKTLKFKISIPDIQMYWILPAIVKGMQVLFKERYDAILTTSPPPSAHLVGLVLSKMTRRPLIADFRDPWVGGYNFKESRGPIRRLFETWLEKKTVAGSTTLLANTKQNEEKLLICYPRLRNNCIQTITNGYDSALLDDVPAKQDGYITICHTGVLYPDLAPFFFLEAFAKWITQKNDSALRKKVRLLLVGSNTKYIIEIIDKLHLNEFTTLLPRVNRREALAIAKGADLLVVSLGFKNEIASTIPGKLYDYIGLNRPILGILPKDGAAARLIEATGTGRVISSPDNDRITNIFDELYTAREKQTFPMWFSPNACEIKKYDAQAITRRLSDVLNAAITRRI